MSTMHWRLEASVDNRLTGFASSLTDAVQLLEFFLWLSASGVRRSWVAEHLEVEDAGSMVRLHASTANAGRSSRIYCSAIAPLSSHVHKVAAS